jgi:Uma2 family endonuclease
LKELGFVSAAVKSLDLDSFLAWEAGQEIKHEFDGTAATAMAGGTAAHALIQSNLAISVGGRLRGNPCRFYGSDLKIAAAGSIRYPDGIVVCTAVPPTARVVTDPVVIFEVLSESTARTDVGAKNREYEATASVQRYIILEQDTIAGMQFERVGGDWIGHILRRDTILRMPEIGIDVPLAELYDGLDQPLQTAAAT